MKYINDMIMSNISSQYDEELLKKEFHVLNSIFNNENLLLKKQKEYEEKYIHLSEKFEKEFKLLNRQHYYMMNALKNVKFKLDSDESKELMVEVEREVLKNIKNTFQTIINKKESMLYTYGYLQEIVQNNLYMKEELIS